MRFFCTAGPVRSQDHYCLPPLTRLALSEVLALIDQQKYFVLHAPRQTGKTTCLLALTEHLNRAGKYHALYCNVELAQAAREDVQRGMHAIFGEMASRARDFLNDPFLFEHQRTLFERFGADGVLNAAITEWSKASAKPIVLLIDEIDALVGDVLISVLRQLRAGYDKRPQHFPQSIMLCGVRDVRDYRMHSTQEQAIITGGSAFNIKAESLRLENFQRREIAALIRQHTDATGQVFAGDSLEQIWHLTRGQPWLVNALCYEACFKAAAGRDRTRPITAAMMEAAKEQIVRRRETHIDQLVDKLAERRVQTVIEPILAGVESTALIPTDDILYVRDLGLIQTDEGQLKIANRIYQEVIPRELTFSTELTFAHQPAWYIQANGRLDLDALIAAFQQFFREHSASWLERFNYKEAGPHLLMQAFLQRIVNSGGRVEREYGLGRKRTDLLVIWPYKGEVQKAVIELKILRGSRQKTVAEGLEQTRNYMDLCATDEGHLLIFDRAANKTWSEKVFRRTEPCRGTTITTWGM